MHLVLIDFELFVFDDHLMVGRPKSGQIDRVRIRPKSVDLKFFGDVKKIRPDHLRAKRQQGQFTVPEKGNEHKDKKNGNSYGKRSEFGYTVFVQDVSDT